ncbi:MAG: subclass B1 metallo-beta-lactamase [Saprospiraceae bacterium]|nr:subclass B1 metallo-beta-lactamase [Saprospiraceae bacterium]
MTDTLKVERLTPNTYVHISYLDSPTFGKVACNGLIYKSGKEVVVFDTPASDPVSKELIKWIRLKLGCEIKAIVVNHFHSDCLGGLQAFHVEGIVSYANSLTIKLAKDNGAVFPQIGFEESDTIILGNKIIVNQHFGEGHTKDNIVSYIADEEVIFGGCLIKEVGASNGNLEDANISEWSNTVRKIKEAYPQVKWIVPGHGKSGGVELLDYTIKLFEE